MYVGDVPRSALYAILDTVFTSFSRGKNAVRKYNNKASTVVGQGAIIIF
jgi:hypothetical protein